MMKNHDIHENKNPCPEFNGEKMHEHFYQQQKETPHGVSFCLLLYAKRLRYRVLEESDFGGSEGKYYKEKRDYTEHYDRKPF